MKLSNLLENASLVLAFLVLLFISYGTIGDHKISHDFPYGYMASDAFQHQVRAEAIKDMGNFRYEAPYISKGFENAVGRYPPVIYHLSVILSYAAGIEVYDAIYFIVFFFAGIGVLITYFIIRDFSKNVALISLPLPVLVFTHPLLIGFTWGHWPSLLAQFFLISFFWCIMRIGIEKSYVLAAVILTSIIMTHTSEAIFAIIFIVLFFGIRLISKNLKKGDIKNILSAFAISFAASLYYLIIFINTWAKAQPYSFVIEPLWQGNPGFYILDFGILLAFIAAGVVFSMSRLKGMHTSLIMALAMLIGGFLNYAGFGLRSFQIRFFWPIYLSALFGLGVYMLCRLFIKKWNMSYSVALFGIFGVLLIGLIKVPLVPSYSGSPSQGIMSPYHWSALEWLSKNTGINSKIYFFYGDIYSQDALLRNSKRVHYQVEPDDFIKAINDRKIKRYYISELPGDDGGNIAIRAGLFSFEYASKLKPLEYFLGLQDICRFDFLIFDKASRQQALAQYNLLVASELLKKDYISRVFENSVVVILKNNNAGGDCIEERSF